MLVKNKNDVDYSENVKLTYNSLISQVGCSARITDIWRLLQLAFGIKEFEILTPEQYQNGSFYSYLIDKQIEWINGENVDFSEISQVILETGDFTNMEKLLFTSGNLEEKLWAIYLVICDPTINNL